ncbi:hypothetical protein ON010_g17369 [Phytophthora cinnamomi]|nr:hypothetical protein ON010_g17369 [Phytophthora cinnamomi]
MCAAKTTMSRRSRRATSLSKELQAHRFTILRRQHREYSLRNTTSVSLQAITPRRSPRIRNISQSNDQDNATQGETQTVTPAPANGTQAFFADGADGTRVSATAREVGRLGPSGKPSRKNITLEEFSGLVRPGAFDAGVRRWWRKFQDQLADAQMLDGHRWNDLQCHSIFAASLSGDAADWYSEVRVFVPNLTLETAARMLVDRFKSKLPEQELLRRIMDEHKIRQETYQQ